MSYGTQTAILWAASFICSTFSVSAPLIAAMSTPLGLFSIYFITRLVAQRALRFEQAIIRRVLLLCLSSYFFCALLTTFLQTIYLFLFDDGHFISSIESIEQVFSAIDPKIFGKEFISQKAKLIEAFSIPQTLTTLLLVQNLLMGFICSLFTAPIAWFMLRNRKK